MTPYIEVQVGSTDGRLLYAEFVAIAAAHELEIPTPTVHFFLHRPAPDGWPLRTWTDERRLVGRGAPWRERDLDSG